MTLPTRLARTLVNSAFHQRHPAYVSTSHHGCIRAVGGGWHRYWHSDPVVGALVTRELPFLVGLLPIGPSADLIPRVDLGFGTSADIYLLPDNELDWILLVDAGDLALTRHFQQARNATNLIQKRELPSTRTRRQRGIRRPEGSASSS